VSAPPALVSTTHHSARHSADSRFLNHARARKTLLHRQLGIRRSKLEDADNNALWNRSSYYEGSMTTLDLPIHILEAEPRREEKKPSCRGTKTTSKTQRHDRMHFSKNRNHEMIPHPPQCHRRDHCPWGGRGVVKPYSCFVYHCHPHNGLGWLVANPKRLNYHATT
jgi:hypothetical protein